MSSDDIRTMFGAGKKKYLGAWDFIDGDKTLTIERIEAGVVEGEKGRKDKAPLIFFRKCPRPLACNKTNVKQLVRLFGTARAAELVGKRITLYATTCRGADGGEVDCVRIRPQAPRAQQDSPPPADDPEIPEGMRERQVAAAEGEGR